MDFREIRGWPRVRHRLGLWAGVCISGMLSAASLAQNTSSSPGSGGVAGYHPERDTSITAVNQRPDANRLLEMDAKRVHSQRFAAANAERKRQLELDSVRLLRLAAELNAELGKTDGTEVPLTAATRAEMIEKLAHGIKEKMKLTMAGP